MFAALGMYPFPHLRDDYRTLWSAVASRVVGAPAELDETIDVHESWRRSDLLLGQTCGWPLVTVLRDSVEVVGRFDVDVPFARDGRYRTVLIASKPIGVAEWRQNPSTRCAVNGRDSLSGWVSLQWAWGGEPGDVIETGTHLASVRAVAEGRAHLASIDALSFEHLTVGERALVSRVHVIGHGPMVPTLPLITSSALADRVPELRDALLAATADPSLGPVLQRLRIRGFVPCGADAYADLPALLPGR